MKRHFELVAEENGLSSSRLSVVPAAAPLLRTGVTQRPVKQRPHELTAVTYARLMPAPAPTEMKRPDPPFVVYAAVNPIRRSASHDQFQRPPTHMIRRTPSCAPPVTHQFPVEDPTPYLSSHKAHFSGMGVPRRRESCTPTAHLGLFSETKEINFQLPRSTSHDHFRKSIVPVKRESCRPRSDVSTAPYGADAPEGMHHRPASSDHFQWLPWVVPRQRESYKPKSDVSTAPYETYVAGQTFNMNRTTSKDSFQFPIYSRRTPYAPPKDAGCPY